MPRDIKVFMDLQSVLTRLAAYVTFADKEEFFMAYLETWRCWHYNLVW